MNMKKLFLVCATVTFLAACNNSPKSGLETTKAIVQDTSAQYKNTVNTDTAKTAPVPMVAPLPGKTGVGNEAGNTKETKTSTTITTTTTTTTPAPATTPQSPVSTTTSSAKITGTTPATTTTATDTKTNTSGTTPAVTRQ